MICALAMRPNSKGLISDTAYRRGLGDELAEGSYRLGSKI